MSENLQLDALEARVLGVLIEKDLTTPDQYPLTLNSTTLGANQKSNRDPVLDLLESDVYGTLQKLVRKSLVGSVHPLGARVEKFRHNADAILQLQKPQLAVIAELLLRGPQQPGELRGRASRMAPIETLEQLTSVLTGLIERKLVVRHAPPPGSRAEFYSQALAPTGHALPVAPAAPPARAVEPRLSANPPRTFAPSTTTSAFAHSAPSAPLVTPAADVTAIEARMREAFEKRIADLEFNSAKLRRQLDHLAWKLNQKLEG